MDKKFPCIHTELSRKICMCVHNCKVCCVPAGTGFCNPHIEMEVFHLSKTGFCIKAYDDPITNVSLLELAEPGYDAEMIIEDGIKMIRYAKI